MKQKCQKCGQEYMVGRFSFGSTMCGACKPHSFFTDPLWLQPSVAGTKDLWRTALVLHVIMFFLLRMLLDGGEVSIPGMLYCLMVIFYLAIRFVIAQIRGYPILSKSQALAFFLLPIYGLVLSITLFNLANHIRWGTRW